MEVKDGHTKVKDGHLLSQGMDGNARSRMGIYYLRELMGIQRSRMCIRRLRKGIYYFRYLMSMRG